MNHLIKTLFCENPHIPEEIFTYCKKQPEFLQARQDYQRLARQIEQHMGEDFYLKYEEVLNAYQAREVHAYYLFGLGLRQELLASLG